MSGLSASWPASGSSEIHLEPTFDIGRQLRDMGARLSCPGHTVGRLPDLDRTPAPAGLLTDAPPGDCFFVVGVRDSDGNVRLLRQLVTDEVLVRRTVVRLRQRRRCWRATKADGQGRGHNGTLCGISWSALDFWRAAVSNFADFQRDRSGCRTSRPFATDKPGTPHWQKIPRAQCLVTLHLGVDRVIIYVVASAMVFNISGVIRVTSIRTPASASFPAPSCRNEMVGSQNPSGFN